MNDQQLLGISAHSDKLKSKRNRTDPNKQNPQYQSFNVYFYITVLINNFLFCVKMIINNL